MPLCFLAGATPRFFGPDLLTTRSAGQAGDRRLVDRLGVSRIAA